MLRDEYAGDNDRVATYSVMIPKLEGSKFG